MKRLYLNYVFVFLAGCFISNTLYSLSSFHKLHHHYSIQLPVGLESFHGRASTSRRTAAAAVLSTSSEIPVIIISSLRPQYLQLVMESLNEQHTNTPTWIGRSPRYVFVHRHTKNDIGDSYQQVQELAQKYDYTIINFKKHNPKLPLNLNANLVWYQMMNHLFQEVTNHEAFIVEDDVTLAPDGLMVAARLFQQKRQRMDVHSIALGGSFGYNRINPDPNTYMAARSPNFQPMAYSMDSNLFRQLEEQKKKLLREKPILEHIPDWTEEIGRGGFIKNLTILSPSISRMHHIGAIGMGPSGKGNEKREIAEQPGWDYWRDQLVQPNHTIDDMYLEPKSVTDWGGFVCHPIRASCCQKNLPNSVVPREPRTTHMMPGGVKLGLQLPIIGVESSLSANDSPPSFAIDGDMYTRWGGRRRIRRPAWIRVDLGSPSRISSISIHWDCSFATNYNIQTSTDLKTFVTLQTVEDGEGVEDFFAFEDAPPLARYIQINAEKNVNPTWDFGIWEIIVRGGQ